MNHPDFFSTIAENTRIYTGDILQLEESLLRLKDGTSIKSDAILCGTGWVSSLQFFSQAQCKDLGLPYLLSEESPEESSHWAQLASTADQKVVSTFPYLANPPPHWHRPVIESPYRLYKLITPLSHPVADDVAQDRSIVFIGLVGVGNYFPVVESQAMWATAYLDGKINVPSRAKQEEEVALFNAWCARRYLSSGDPGNNLTFEAIGYCDELLRDLGLSSHRKGWWSNLLKPFKASDYSGLKDEYVRRHGQEAF